jgi:hypothetical protein
VGDYTLGTRPATVNAKNTIFIHGKIKCNIHIQGMLSLNDRHILRTITQCFLLCTILSPTYGLSFHILHYQYSQCHLLECDAVHSYQNTRRHNTNTIFHSYCRNKLKISPNLLSKPHSFDNRVNVTIFKET